LKKFSSMSSAKTAAEKKSLDMAEKEALEATKN
jgi:hypothetical protein